MWGTPWQGRLPGKGSSRVGRLRATGHSQPDASFPPPHLGSSEFDGFPTTQLAAAGPSSTFTSQSVFLSLPNFQSALTEALVLENT